MLHLSDGDRVAGLLPLAMITNATKVLNFHENSRLGTRFHALLKMAADDCLKGVERPNKITARVWRVADPIIMRIKLPEGSINPTPEERLFHISMYFLLRHARFATNIQKLVVLPAYAELLKFCDDMVALDIAPDFINKYKNDTMGAISGSMIIMKGAQDYYSFVDPVSA